MDTIEKAKEAAFKAAYDSLSGADYDEVRTAVMIAIDAYDKARPKLHFVFDAFPSPEGSRLIEVEDDSGCSVSLEWASRNDGNVELCVNSHASLVEEVERLREALTPSGETKAAYMGEFTIKVVVGDDDGEDIHEYYTVPWTTIKEIMAAIRERANA